MNLLPSLIPIGILHVKQIKTNINLRTFVYKMVL